MLNSGDIVEVELGVPAGRETGFSHPGVIVTAQRILDGGPSVVHVVPLTTTIREFLQADLIDEMHIAVVPILLGRGERLWDGLEGLEQRFDIEAVASPSGVVHLTFSRRR